VTGSRPLALLAAAAGLALALASMAAGAWWMTPVVGAVLGLLLRGGVGGAAAALVGALAWGLPLAWLSLQGPVGRVAEVIVGILGAKALGSAGGLALPVLLGALLGLAGWWAGTAVRRLAWTK